MKRSALWALAIVLFFSAVNVEAYKVEWGWAWVHTHNNKYIDGSEYFGMFASMGIDTYMDKDITRRQKARWWNSYRRFSDGLLGYVAGWFSSIWCHRPDSS